MRGLNDEFNSKTVISGPENDKPENSVGKERIVFELNAHVVKPNIKDISDSAEVMEGAFKSVIESTVKPDIIFTVGKVGKLNGTAVKGRSSRGRGRGKIIENLPQGTQGKIHTQNGKHANVGDTTKKKVL